MAACGHCSACCAHCGAVCGAAHGAPAGGLAGAFHANIGMSPVRYFGGIGYMPYVAGSPVFPLWWQRHKKTDGNDDPNETDAAKAAGEADAKTLHCDALVDSNHPGHQAAVQTVAHGTDEQTHESILKRIKEDLAKL